MIRTWMGELAIVAGVVLPVAGQSGRPIELIGAMAVVLSFAHAQVADRLAENESRRMATLPIAAVYRAVYDAGPIQDRMTELAHRGVHCHRWAGRYFVGKEILWCAYFAAHGSWSALAGVGLFLAYPLWRRWWRARHPL